MVFIHLLELTVPDEKLRYIDPEGGYEDPDEVTT